MSLSGKIKGIKNTSIIKLPNAEKSEDLNSSGEIHVINDISKDKLLKVEKSREKTLSKKLHDRGLEKETCGRKNNSDKSSEKSSSDTDVSKPSIRSHSFEKGQNSTERKEFDPKCLIQLLHCRSELLDKLIKEDEDFKVEVVKEQKHKQIKQKRKKSMIRPKGMVDLDKHYFTLIQHRTPIKTKIFCKHAFITILNNCLRNNIQTGYLRDEILKINKKLLFEKELLENFHKYYSQLKHLREDFLYEDYVESMEIVTNAAQEEAHTVELKNILTKKQIEARRIKNEVYNLRDLYDKHVNCANFLSSLTSWYTFKSKESFEMDSNTDLASVVMSTVTLDGLVEDTLKEMRYNKRSLFFTDPDQIFEIFKIIERSNVHFWKSVVKFKKTKSVKERFLLELEEEKAKEINLMLEKIEDLEEEIRFQGELIEYNKHRLDKLINKDFKRSIICKECIKINTYVAEAFKTIMDIKSTDTSASILFGYIEEEYENLILEIELIPQATFSEILDEVYAASRKTRKQAMIAKRRLAEEDILARNSLKLLDKPCKLTHKKLMQRSYPFEPKHLMPETAELTEAQKLHNYLFTREPCPPQRKFNIYAFKNKTAVSTNESTVSTSKSTMSTGKSLASKNESSVPTNKTAVSTNEKVVFNDKKPMIINNAAEFTNQTESTNKKLPLSQRIENFFQSYFQKLDE